MSAKPKRKYYKDPEFLIAFGSQLRDVRNSKGLSQEQLANECDFEISQISRIERGVSNSSISTINRIAACLNVSLAELFSFKQ